MKISELLKTGPGDHLLRDISPEKNDDFEKVWAAARKIKRAEARFYLGAKGRHLQKIRRKSPPSSRRIRRDRSGPPDLRFLDEKKR